MSGKAFIFSAPSGAGKTTIVRHLLTKFPNLSFSISATTRAKRGYEIDEMDYYFLSQEDFQSNVDSNKFLEWEEVYEGLRYGTLHSEVERVWNAGKAVVFDVDVVGAINLKKKLGEKALAVFIGVKDIAVLRKRLENRKTENPETLDLRMSKAASELGYQDQFDKIIFNHDLEVAFAEAVDIVTEFLEK